MKLQAFLIPVLLTSFVCIVTLTGRAQDTAAEFGADDLSRAVHQQDLDSYWLDQRKWMAYGYRPHLKANYRHFTNLPDYSPNHNYYSYGITYPAPPLKDPLNKKHIQLTKYGTWH